MYVLKNKGSHMTALSVCIYAWSYVYGSSALRRCSYTYVCICVQFLASLAIFAKLRELGLAKLILELLGFALGDLAWSLSLVLRVVLLKLRGG